MAETAESVRRETSEKRYIPDTARLADLSSTAEKDDVERVASHIRQNLLDVDATVKAIREHLTMDHVKWAASSAMRKALTTPDRRKKGVMAFSALVLVSVIGAITYLRLRRRRFGKRLKNANAMR